MPLHTINNTVVVASDDARLVTAITTSLRAGGFEVCSHQQSHAQPRVIVLDTAISPDARARLLHTCRARSSDASTPPIIALAPREALRATVAQEGVWVCLAKPVELDSLLSAVARISCYTTD